MNIWIKKLVQFNLSIYDVQAFSEQRKRQEKNLLVTLGSDGAILRTKNGEIIKVTAPKTEVIDTTGAGDGFVGAFAAALNAGKELQIALEFAIKFASNSVGKKGAQSSYPTNLKIS